MNEIIRFSNIAHDLLNRESRYSANKLLIKSVFENTRNNYSTDSVIARLTLIDSFYSTQLNKRLYGIENIAESIAQFSDEVLNVEIQSFLENTNSESTVSNLLFDNYGYNKEGNSFGRATSLISKYLYFLNGYSFPIYDRMAFSSYPVLRNHIDDFLPVLRDANYFDTLINFNHVTGINNFERVDNLLWLIGKFRTGSFSIIMNEANYLNLTSNDEIQHAFELINESSQRNKSVLKDDAIRAYIFTNFDNIPFFNEEERDFIQFIANL